MKLALAVGLLSCSLTVLGQTDIAELIKRAEQGDADAQFNLGFRYGIGRDVPQDYAEAANWFRAAAEQGNAPAQNNLGVMYDNGRGVPQDFTEAVKWYRLAAELGHPSGQFNLGAMYSRGAGVPQDYTQAYVWRNLAAARANGADAKRFAETRDVTASSMTPEQLTEAQRLTRDWKPKTWEELKPE